MNQSCKSPGLEAAFLTLLYDVPLQQITPVLQLPTSVSFASSNKPKNLTIGIPSFTQHSFPQQFSPPSIQIAQFQSTNKLQSSSSIFPSKNTSPASYSHTLNSEQAFVIDQTSPKSNYKSQHVHLSRFYRFVSQVGRSNALMQLGSYAFTNSLHNEAIVCFTLANNTTSLFLAGFVKMIEGKQEDAFELFCRSRNLHSLTALSLKYFIGHNAFDVLAKRDPLFHDLGNDTKNSTKTIREAFQRLENERYKQNEANDTLPFIRKIMYLVLALNELTEGKTQSALDNISLSGSSFCINLKDTLPPNELSEHILTFVIDSFHNTANAIFNTYKDEFYASFFEEGKTDDFNERIIDFLKHLTKGVNSDSSDERTLFSPSFVGLDNRLTPKQTPPRTSLDEHSTIPIASLTETVGRTMDDELQSPLFNPFTNTPVMTPKHFIPDASPNSVLFGSGIESLNFPTLPASSLSIFGRDSEIEKGKRTENDHACECDVTPKTVFHAAEKSYMIPPHKQGAITFLRELNVSSFKEFLMLRSKLKEFMYTVEYQFYLSQHQIAMEKLAQDWVSAKLFPQFTPTLIFAHARKLFSQCLAVQYERQYHESKVTTCPAYSFATLDYPDNHDTDCIFDVTLAFIDYTNNPMIYFNFCVENGIDMTSKEKFWRKILFRAYSERIDESRWIYILGENPPNPLLYSGQHGCLVSEESLLIELFQATQSMLGLTMEWKLFFNIIWVMLSAYEITGETFSSFISKSCPVALNSQHAGKFSVRSGELFRCHVQLMQEYIKQGQE